MTKYTCIKALNVEKYGDNGELLEEVFEIAEGTTWEVEETSYNMVVSNEGVRLINSNAQWLEIYQDTLVEHFALEVNNLSDLNDEQSKELEGYIESFNIFKAYIEGFIARNNLDEDEVYEKIEKDYEEAMSRQHG